jgi:hypothetical protein
VNAANNAADGWPLLADDFFRLAHQDYSGKPLLHHNVAGLGLAAALLAELTFTGRITVAQSRVTVVDLSPPEDPLAHSVLGQLASEATVHPVRIWLAYLGRHAYQDVARRLLTAGHVQEEVTRKLLSKTVVFRPTDVNTAAWPWARLTTQLRTEQPLNHYDTFLAGLVIATDLHKQVLDGMSAEVVAGLRHAVSAAWPPVRELLHQTEVAVGSAVVTGR